MKRTAFVIENMDCPTEVQKGTPKHNGTYFTHVRDWEDSRGA